MLKHELNGQTMNVRISDWKIDTPDVLIIAFELKSYGVNTTIKREEKTIV